MNPIARYFRDHATPLEPNPTALAPALAPLPGLKCVAFDIYGTLMISGSGDIGVSDAEAQSESLRSILRQAGARDLPAQPAECLAELIAQSHRESREAGIEFPEVDILEIWQGLLARAQAPEPSPGDLALMAAQYEMATNPVWPMPGARELLASLRQQGLRLGIVSNAQFYTPALFEAFWESTVEDLGFDPDLCFYSYQDKQAKPGTWLYQQLREALAADSLLPEETLYLGNDALKDVHAAASVGFKTALFAGDQRSLRLRQDHPDLLPPDAIVTEMAQVAQLVGECATHQ